MAMYFKNCISLRLLVRIVRSGGRLGIIGERARRLYLFDLIDLIDLFNLFDLFDLFDLIEWATHRLEGAAGDAAAPLARQIAQGARAAT